MKRHKLTNFLVASGRIQHESQYWTGYDPKLIEQVSEEAKKVEDAFSEVYDAYLSLKSERRGSLSRFAIALVCISLLIGFSVYAGTHWSNTYEAARRDVVQELRQNLENGEFEKLGYQKVKIGEPGYSTYTIFVKKD